MICYNHPETGIVANCNQCSKGLCVDYTNKFSIPLCNACAVAIARQGQNLIFRNIVLTVAFAVLGFLFVHSFNNMPLITCLSWAYFAAGIPWGWSALNKITPNIFLMLPAVGWAIYFLVKLILSCYVGIVAFPWKIFISVREWRRSQRLKLVASENVILEKGGNFNA